MSTTAMDSGDKEMGKPRRVTIKDNGFAWDGAFQPSHHIDPVEASEIIEKTGARFVGLNLPKYSLKYRSLSAVKAQAILREKINELDEAAKQ